MCCELSCANLKGKCQFHAKSHKVISAFVACPPVRINNDDDD